MRNRRATDFSFQLISHGKIMVIIGNHSRIIPNHCYPRLQKGDRQGSFVCPRSAATEMDLIASAWKPGDLAQFRKPSVLRSKSFLK